MSHEHIQTWMLSDRTTCRECGLPMGPGEMVAHVLYQVPGGRAPGDYHPGPCPKPESYWGPPRSAKDK